MSKKNKDRHKCSLFPYERQDCFSLQEAKQNAGWNITAFNLPKAWEHSQGEGVTIAVLDTGCDMDHSDLVENLLPGCNFVTPGKKPIDGNGHGTHVIGTLVAANNDIGIVGVCPKAKVHPVKVLADDGNGNLLNVAKGIRWAIEQKVDLISMSLGAPFPVQEVRKAIQAAQDAGIVCFVAAGNAGNTKDVFYPAAYPETVAVGAVDINMRRASFSNTGKNLDFMAPGVDIFSTVPDNWYATLSGTSMAQPFVCGVAALLLSYVRNKKTELSLRTANDYIEFLKKYTIPVKGDVYEQEHFYQGFGIIDPQKFIESIH
jgi:subtilisin family serine protease